MVEIEGSFIFSFLLPGPLGNCWLTRFSGNNQLVWPGMELERRYYSTMCVTLFSLLIVRCNPDLGPSNTTNDGFPCLVVRD